VQFCRKAQRNLAPFSRKLRVLHNQPTGLDNQPSW